MPRPPRTLVLECARAVYVAGACVVQRRRRFDDVRRDVSGLLGPDAASPALVAAMGAVRAQDHGGWVLSELEVDRLLVIVEAGLAGLPPLDPRWTAPDVVPEWL